MNFHYHKGWSLPSLRTWAFFNKILPAQLSLSPVSRKKKKGKKVMHWYMFAWLPVMAGWYVGKAKMPKNSLILPCMRCQQTQDCSDPWQKWGISSSTRVTEDRDVSLRQPLSSCYHWHVPLNWTSKYSSVAMEAVGRAILPQYTKGNR